MAGRAAMAAVLLATAIPALAQSGPNGGPPGSSSDSMALNAALVRLGENPRDLVALIDAGTAAMAIGDVDAAIGFYTRADQVSPGNPRVKSGLASALVQSGNPYDAIPLFLEAERNGGIDAKAALDWGLAYDLVANNTAAQRYYRQALAAGPSDEAVRRLSLSLAIAGDKRGSEIAIKPLLDRQDKAAWRTRAFSLAILGRPDEAISVINATLPPDLAGAIAPYLRYMPRLTPAQQAAAASFGQFPRASEIGIDDARVAAFATNTRRNSVAAADTTLIPSGRPLGQANNVRESREARREREAREAQEQRRAREQRERLAREQREAEQRRQREIAEAEAAARRNRNTTVAAASPSPVARPMLTVPGTATPLPARPAAVPTPAPATVAANRLPPPVPTSLPVPSAPSAPSQVAAASPAVPGPAVPPVAAPAPPSPTPARLAMASPPSAPTASAGQPAQSITLPVGRRPGPTPAPAAVPPAQRRRVADAFGDISTPVADAGPAAGAVDIRRIRPSRTVESPSLGAAAARTAAARPMAPVHPSRIWVQIGTGRDRDGLAADWRRLSRSAAALFRAKRAYISSWNRTNRLLTGPFESEAAANAFIYQLKRADIGAFLWTSPAGQVVDELGGRETARAVVERSETRSRTRQQPQTRQQSQTRPPPRTRQQSQTRPPPRTRR